MIHLKTESEIECMADAGQIIAKLFDEMRSLVHPGTNTAELDLLAEDYIRSYK